MISYSTPLRPYYSRIKGFNRRGLYRMKQFYEAYANYEKVSPLVTQINWTNNLLILSGTNMDLADPEIQQHKNPKMDYCLFSLSLQAVLFPSITYNVHNKHCLIVFPTHVYCNSLVCTIANKTLFLQYFLSLEILSWNWEGILHL